MLDAKSLLTFAIVLAAVGYLVRRTWIRLSGRRGVNCGPCSRCVSTADSRSAVDQPLIPVETLIASAAQVVDDGTRPSS